jgi:signal transduction histidine kinase
MVALEDSRLFRTPRQRAVLIAGSALLFAWGVGATEPSPISFERAALVTVLAAVAIASWSLPLERGLLLRYAALGFAGVALYGLNTHGPGQAAVFAAVALAELRLTERSAVALSLVLVATLEVVLAVHGAQAAELVLILLGFGLLFLAMAASRRTRLAGQRARQAELESAVADERSRLAREIHDVLAHSLTALVVQLDSAKLLADKQPEAVPEAIDRAARLARTGLDESRQAIGALRGDTLPGPDLLATLVSDFEVESKVPVALDVSGRPIALSSEARLAIYRTAQEALTNIRKHAHPRAVDVKLAYSAEGAELLVEDTGDPAAQELAGSGGGYGLSGMRERAELAGGRLEAGPTATGGFKVRLWLPA